MSPLDRPRNLEPCYFTGFIQDSTIEISAYFRPHGSAILTCRWANALSSPHVPSLIDRYLTGSIATLHKPDILILRRQLYSAR